MDEYSPSVFSRTTKKSMSPGLRPASGERTPGIRRTGRRFTYWSNSRRNLQQRAPERDVVGHRVRPADRAEIDRIVAADPRLPVVGHHLAMLGIVVAGGEVEIVERDGDVEALGSRLQHAQPSGTTSLPMPSPGMTAIFRAVARHGSPPRRQCVVRLGPSMPKIAEIVNYKLLTIYRLRVMSSRRALEEPPMSAEASPPSPNRSLMTGFRYERVKTARRRDQCRDRRQRAAAAAPARQSADPCELAQDRARRWPRASPSSRPICAAMATARSRTAARTMPPIRSAPWAQDNAEVMSHFGFDALPGRRP